jgi:hypothetical protein
MLEGREEAVGSGSGPVGGGARGMREKIELFWVERTVLAKASSELDTRRIRRGSDESVWRELATLNVGDCGGEENVDMLGSAWSPRRENAFPDKGGDACEIGTGPPLGTNFLLNEGTLKFGAGGDAHRIKCSGTGGEGASRSSITSVMGRGGGIGDIYTDCRTP